MVHHWCVLIPCYEFNYIFNNWPYIKCISMQFWGAPIDAPGLNLGLQLSIILG